MMSGLKFWHFQILRSSDIFQLWHHLILALSGSGTNQFGLKIGSDTYGFWHFPSHSFDFSEGQNNEKKKIIHSKDTWNLD